MRGLLVEAALVLLAQSALHCREISLHHLYRTGIRDNVLGPREKTVSLKQISLSLSPLFDVRNLTPFELQTTNAGTDNEI